MPTTEEALAEGAFRAGVGRFQDADLEREYQHDYFERSIRTVRAALVLGIALFVLFAAVDPFLVPDGHGRLQFVRLGIVCPLLVAILAWSYSPRFERWVVLGQVLAVFTGGSAIVYMGSIGDHFVADAQFIGLLLAVMWTHSVSRLRFGAATVAALVLSAEYAAGELLLDRLGATQFVNNLLLLASTNLIGMIASWNLEAGSRRDFQQRRLLNDRRSALQASVNRLSEAEQRVSELESRAPDRVENLPKWADQIACEIRQTVASTEVRVWRCVNGQPVALTAGDLSPPSRDDVRAVGSMGTDASGNVIVPLSGLTGELFGMIVIASPANWGSHESRLVGGFARYLGGALETLEKREALAQEQARREDARRTMQDRGVGAMWLCPTCGRCFDDSDEVCDVDGSRLVPRLLPYRIQGRYKLLRLLGQGGMGQVFLASDERLLRDVAIKVLHGEAPLDADTRALLAHEARAVARIGHPGVVDVFDLGELEDGSAFIVMEFLTGRALSEEIKRHGSGSPHQVASLLRQVAAALSAAHQTGVVHRDIKPQNVFLTQVADGFQARLLDFGIARVHGRASLQISSGAIMGTPAYMAPEQITGEEGDERTDIYALAAVVYEALVGERLVGNGSVAATLSAIMNDPLPSISPRVTGAPPELDMLFHAALARDPGQRPRSVAEWADAVAVILEAMPSRPTWPTPITHELSVRADTPFESLSLA